MEKMVNFFQRRHHQENMFILVEWQSEYNLFLIAVLWW